jgi:hypothetical protein
MTASRAWLARYKAEWRPHTEKTPGGLTPGQHDVLLAFRTYIPRAGDPPKPSLDDLADVASCSVKTAQRALAAARQLGLLGKPE